MVISVWFVVYIDICYALFVLYKFVELGLYIEPLGLLCAKEN